MIIWYLLNYMTITILLEKHNSLSQVASIAKAKHIKGKVKVMTCRAHIHK